MMNIYTVYIGFGTAYAPFKEGFSLLANYLRSFMYKAYYDYVNAPFPARGLTQDVSKP